MTPPLRLHSWDSSWCVREKHSKGKEFEKGEKADPYLDSSVSPILQGWENTRVTGIKFCKVAVDLLIPS